MTEGNIARLLKEMEHGDQDNREMAANDMTTEILKGTTLSAHLEKSICQAFVKQLRDVSLNVRGNAVKCLSKIGSKISEHQFGLVANNLTECVIKESEEFRDIYSTCLKTLISEADEAFGKTLCQCLLDALINGTDSKDEKVVEQCIEITNELLKRFNAVIVNFPDLINKDKLLNNLIGRLDSANETLRKRSCTCIGSLAVVLIPKQLNHLIGLLIKRINPKDRIASNAFVETLGAVSGTVGYKLAPNLNLIMDVISPFCVIEALSDAKLQDVDNFIKEISLNIFDFSVRKCPKEVAVYLDKIMDFTLELIGYDPNFNSDVAMEEAAEEEMEGWGEVEEEQMPVDSDSSWKVRKAAANLLSTIVKFRNDKIKANGERVMGVLLMRLSETDESIRCQLLNIFSDMIKSIVVGDTSSEDEIESAMLLTRKSSAELLLKDLPISIKKIIKLINDKSLPVREAVANLQYNLAIAVPDYMNGILLDEVLPPMLSVFKESSSTVKIILLQTIRRLIRTAISPDSYMEFLKGILDILNCSIKDDYYRLQAESFKTAGSLVKLLKKEGPNKEADSTVKEIYALCKTKFDMTDIDQEIKLGTIFVMGNIVAHASDILTEKEIDNICGSFIVKLDNESLRYSVMKAFHNIVSSNTPLKIEDRLKNSMSEFLSMAHKIARPVKMAALDTLNSISQKYPKAIEKSEDLIMKDLSSLLTEPDFQLAQSTLKLFNFLVNKASDDVIISVMEYIIDFCKTPLLNLTRNLLIQLFQAIASKAKGDLNPKNISEKLFGILVEKNLRSIAAIIAKVLLIREEWKQVIPRYIELLLKETENIDKKKLTLIIIGNIGMERDLSTDAKLNSTLDGLLQTKEEELKPFVPVCFGKIALGNKKHYIPNIMEKLKSKSSYSNLMLIALKEIVSASFDDIKESISELLPVLYSQANTDDDGNREIIAEIIGRLLFSNETSIISEVETRLKDANPFIRATYALSFKFWYHKGQHDLTYFHTSILKLLELLNETHPKVQKALLDSLAHVAHQNSLHLRGQAAVIVSGVLPWTVVNKSLIRIVDLGPLQHKIDEGEPVRKGCFILLENMLDDLNDKMDLPAIGERLVDGLGDDSDEVQNSSQQIVIKLCELSSGTILGLLEKMLEKIVAISQRLQNSLNGYLRVLIAMNKLPEIDLNERFQSSMKELLSVKTTQIMYDELRKLTK